MSKRVWLLGRCNQRVAFQGKSYVITFGIGWIANGRLHGIAKMVPS